jgi:haloalkane dehalogenase
MHYQQSGEGDPIVLLHGNPTSSYLWRSVIPILAGTGRCLAPDLIGMGRSDKPDIKYCFADHARYLDAWFDTLDLDRVTLVGHDWGGALGFDWAARHPDRVTGVAFMETIVRPLTSDDLPDQIRDLFAALRRPGEGEAMVLDNNVFIEAVLPVSMLRTLTPEEHDAYRAPFRSPADRRPMLVWAREIPIDGQPPGVAARVADYGTWLQTSRHVPKLLLTFEPSAVMTPELVRWCQDHIAALQTRHIGPGLHFVQEDQGLAIGAAIAEWITSTRDR